MKSPMADDLSDAQLAKLAQSGDEQALDRLTLRYAAFVKYRCRRFAAAGQELDDLTQEGFIGFIAAVRSFDAGRSTSFRTYAALLIDRFLTDVVRSGGARRRCPEAPVLSMDALLLSAEGDALLPAAKDRRPDPEAQYIEEETLFHFWQRVSRKCSPLEIQVLRLYLTGHSYAAVASRLHIGVKAVDNALLRVRRKLRS